MELNERVSKWTDERKVKLMDKEMVERTDEQTI